MSSSSYKAVRQLNYEEVVRYLVGKDIATTCPACGEQQHQIERGIDAKTDVGYFISLPVSVVDGSGYIINHNPTSISVSIITSCLNCGYNRSFSLGNILAYLDSQERK